MKINFFKSSNLSFIFALLALSFTGKISLANDSNMHEKCLKADDYEGCMSQVSVHDKCLEATDYKGCMEYSKNPENLNTTKIISPNDIDCSYRNCSPEEAKGKVDNLGMKVIPGWRFTDMPAKRAAGYVNPEIYQVQVNNKYGRYIQLMSVIRFYQEPQAGTSGYSTNIGGSSTNCYGTGGSFNCYTRPPAQLTIPGRAAIPGGIIQQQWDYILDCEDEVYATFFKERLVKTINKKGKRKKWVMFSEAKDDWVKTKGISFCRTKKDMIEYLKPSTFSLYKYKDIKKRTSSKSKNVGNINCDSPVWKNKPKCN